MLAEDNTPPISPKRVNGRVNGKNMMRIVRKVQPDSDSESLVNEEIVTVEIEPEKNNDSGEINLLVDAALLPDKPSSAKEVLPDVLSSTEEEAGSAATNSIFEKKIAVVTGASSGKNTFCYYRKIK
jgi:hypothetical protein